MRKLFVFTGLFFLLTNVVAQTNTFPATGNVGIGTTSPGNYLQIGSIGSTGYGGNQLALGNGTDIFAIGLTPGFTNLYSNGTPKFYTGAGILTLTLAASEALFTGAVTGNAASFTTGNFSGDLTLNATDGRSILSRTANSNAWLLANTFNVTGTGSKTDLNTYVYGNNAYTVWTNGTRRQTIDGSGNVGIGTASPANMLQVGSLGSTGYGGNQLALGNGSDVFVVGLTPGISNVYSNGSFKFYTGSGGDVAMALSSSDVAFNGSVTGKAASFTSGAFSGNVGIGTATPSEKLSVNGNIRAKKMIVTQTGWSDYVFYDEYKLRNLSSLETFIKQHKHLPEIPSAKEVEEKGINIGDTQALLLKKIEELTLYIIDLKKNEEKLTGRIQLLEKKSTKSHSNKG